MTKFSYLAQSFLTRRSGQIYNLQGRYALHEKPSVVLSFCCRNLILCNLREDYLNLLLQGLESIFVPEMHVLCRIVKRQFDSL